MVLSKWIKVDKWNYVSQKSLTGIQEFFLFSVPMNLSKKNKRQN
jgi:hypothetical protein